MPDRNGKFVGAGWSRAREDAYTRIFGNAASQQRSAFPCVLCQGETYRMDSWSSLRLCTPCDCVQRVPRASSPEVPPDCNGCGEDGHVTDDCPDHPAR